MKNWKLIFGILGALLIIAAGTLAYLEYFYRYTPSPEKPKKLINAGEKIIKLGRREDLRQEVDKALAEKIGEGDFRVFLFAETKNGLDFYLPAQEFFSELNLSTQKLLETTKNYNLGALGPSYPFLIIEVSRFEEAFASALEWEKSMPQELGVFFSELRGTGAVSRDFKDRVIRNQDVRVYESGPPAGGGKIFYTFFNKNLFIITNSERTLGEILSRYAIFPPN